MNSPDRSPRRPIARPGRAPSGRPRRRRGGCPRPGSARVLREGVPLRGVAGPIPGASTLPLRPCVGACGRADCRRRCILIPCADATPERQAPAGQYVYVRQLFREHDRVPHRECDDIGPEPHALGHRCRGGELRDDRPAVRIEQPFVGDQPVPRGRTTQRETVTLISGSPVQHVRR